MNQRTPSPAILAMPMPGDLVLGGFRIIEVIGAGSYAVAYRAQQLGTDRDAVIKVPHAHLLASPQGPELRRRFAAEARAATRLEHPHIVTVYLVGETPRGLPAIAMEYVPGQTLGSRLARGEVLTMGDALQLGHQLSDALAELHAAGIVHRDLSPGNVILEDTSSAGPLEAKLLDFGVARLLDGPQRSSGPVGTPGYMAPEQYRGEAGPKVDVYSLGALLWWCFTGRELERSAPLGPRPRIDPRAHNPAISPPLAVLIGQALAAQPFRRPAMAEFHRRWAGTMKTAGALDEPLPRPPSSLTTSSTLDDHANTDSAEHGRSASATSRTRSSQRPRRAPRWNPPSRVLREPSSSPNPSSPEPHLRAPLIERLRRRDPELLARRLRSFIGGVPEHLAQIEVDLRRAELATLREPCERLRSSARSVGADGLAVRAQAIARAAKRGALDRARVELAAAEAEFRALFPRAFALMQQPARPTSPPLTQESHDPDPQLANY
ncbi:serine/threonine protein kinase [Plesiocystis pacifica SIR-1]|uniref:Serine/threonine protein kinase n=1 Tax=Plesiocystis pacifica SIR-1 TaxID=391625 RepID=A6G2H8_9BACT|nr:protein kinase [Plesiocystis pacifica]EDM79915.1 serine/threonine protein kinase [Plesiocystis pacifica SIR-1]